MIIDLQRFIANERPFWNELEQLLDRVEAEPEARMSLDQLQLFHHLYERTAADLARMTTFSSEPETRRYLENLVARAYGEIHETRDRRRRVQPLRVRRIRHRVLSRCETGADAVLASAGRPVKTRRGGREIRRRPARWIQNHVLDRTDDAQHEGRHSHARAQHDVGFRNDDLAVLQR